MSVAPEFVHEALRLGLITQNESRRFLQLRLPEPRIPKAWTNDAERLEAVIASAASGAPAISGVTMVVEELDSGRRIPSPNGATR